MITRILLGILATLFAVVTYRLFIVHSFVLGGVVLFAMLMIASGCLFWKRVERLSLVADSPTCEFEKADGTICDLPANFEVVLSSLPEASVETFADDAYGDVIYCCRKHHPVLGASPNPTIDKFHKRHLGALTICSINRSSYAEHEHGRHF